MSTATIDAARFSDLAEAADECLRNSPYRALRQVWCECDQDVLLLKGRLPSFYHKQLAQETVGRLPGVRLVVNEIEVG